MQLSQLKPGEHGVITGVNVNGVLRDHLLDMGLTPRTKIFLRKTAPMGDPIEITLRGYELTLRKDDASMIDINKIESAYESGPLCSGHCRDCMKEMTDIEGAEESYDNRACR